MFGNNKPFGTASTFGTSSFGNTSAPFGQNTTAFGAKPSTSNVFGSSGFGMNSLNLTSGQFGASTPAAGTGLFGQPSTGFGAPASTSTGGFGFGTTSTSGGLFGSSAPSTQQSSSGLFGNTSTSAFGAPRPAFGGFGATTTPGTGLFGQTANTGTSLFGTTGGFAGTAPSGTTVKFNPPTGTDTMMKGGVSTSIGTRHQCITCMKEYENKSLEELRMEDYAANRKGGTSSVGMGFGAQAPQAGLFGAPAAASTSAFSFGGTTQAKPLFGTTGATNSFGSTNLFGQPAQNQNSGMFGKSVGFGTPATSAAPAFNFGAATTGNSLFGQTNQAKPLFGQTTGTTGLFGNTATTQPSAFGTNTSFAGFGATNQPTTGLFGAKPTGFGTTNTTTTNTFSFGNTNNMSGGLFGQKPAAPAFGTGNAFGTQTSGFGSFGTTPAAGTGLFGQNKPATTGFGNTGTMFGGGLGSSFGGSNFSMGLGNNTGTGLFGATNTSKAPGFNFGNTGSTGFNFGGANPSSSTFSFGPSPSMPANDPNTAAYQQAQQQILAMTVNPFGDSPLFRNPIKDTPREVELLKPTNPSAQKALLNDSHYKVALVPTAKIKPKPCSPAPTGKMLLFDGLEDEEPSLGTAAFLPKKSVKKLVLKNISSNQSTLTLTSNLSHSQSTRIDVSISLNSPNQNNARTSREPSLAKDVTEISPSNKDNRFLKDVPSRPLSSETSPKNIAPKPRVTFNTNMDDSIAALHTNRQPNSRTYNVWSDSESSFSEPVSPVRDTSPHKNDLSEERETSKGHPTRIVLTKEGYYTVPSQDDMIPLLDEDQKCLVKDFTIGRREYGEVTFPGYINVAGLNLDEIVSFGKKEITVYPDEDKKPPIGQELNRKARITLEKVWPTDKTSHAYITDPKRLSQMHYVEKIKRCTNHLGATFIDYIPETGSWIFEVEHFSKYGLEDSDDEMDIANPPGKQPNVNGAKPPAKQLNAKVPSGDSVQNQELGKKLIRLHPLQDQDMETSSQLFDSSEMLFDESRVAGFKSLERPGTRTEIDTERIHGMKVSFFHEDEENWGTPLLRNESFISLKDNIMGDDLFQSKRYDNRQEFSKKQRFLDVGNEDSYFTSPVPKYTEKGIQKSFSSLSLSTQQSDGWLAELVKSSSKPSYLKTLQGVSNQIYLKPYEQSVLYGKQHLICDSGYFMGRRFRVGWSADGTFSFPSNSYENNTNIMYQKLCETPKSSVKSVHRSSFIIKLHKLACPDSVEEDKSERTIVDILKLQLHQSEFNYVDGIPYFVTNTGTKTIHQMADLFERLAKETAVSSDSERDFIRQCSSVWDLLVSLWGDIKSLEDDESVSIYSIQLARREALSQWLISATKDTLARSISSANDSFKKIFLCMNGRQIDEAVSLALQTGNFRLSILLSQAQGSFVVRKLIAKQLLIWKQNGAYECIKPNLIMLYVLLSGMLVYEDINCCENLDWKQAMALQFWYLCNPNASVQDLVKEYDQSFQGTSPYGRYASPPYAPYYVDESMDAVYDTCYHILKLYCDRSHRFDLLLMPETYSSDHLDFRLSWLLHEALFSVGYNIPEDISCTLLMNFASQLESINLWEWSIFILLHHPDKNWREKQVKDVLLRCVSLDQSEEIIAKETFLDQLHLPPCWIYEAKAIKANTFGKRAEEAWYLIKAESWSKSHSIVIKYLASDAVINEDYDYLLKYLKELSHPDRSCTILDWSSGGQVYLDYINMCKGVQDVLSQEASADDLGNLRPQVVSLCERLSSLPFNSLKDRLSIAEMAKKTATILRSILILEASRNNNNALLTMLASSIQHLPMPYDYAVSDYRFVTQTILEEKASEI